MLGKICYSFRDKSLEEAKKYSLPWYRILSVPAFLTFKSSTRYTFGSFNKFEKSSRGLYICPSCKQEYRKAGIRRHIQFMHINSKKPGYPKHKCDQCGKEVVIKDPLNQNYIPFNLSFRCVTCRYTLNSATTKTDHSSAMCVVSVAATELK